MKLRPSARRWLLVVATLVALFALVGFVIAPPVIRAQLEKRLSAELGRTVTVERVRVNPFALSLTIENFAIQEKDGTKPFLAWRRLYVNCEALSSLWGEWVVGEIALDGFNARVAINADQTFNFSDLLAKFASPAPATKVAAAPAATRPIRVGSLKVTGAQVAFADASRKQPFATTLGPLTFALTNFRTVSERGAPYRFEAVTEANERLAWNGTLRADPVSSAGELVIENLVLAKYAPYYAGMLNADLTGGTLSVRGRYDVSLADGKRVLKLQDGALQLRGLKVAERGSKEIAVELPEFTVSGVEADALTLKAKVAGVALNGGHVRVRREKDGTINLLALLPPAPAPAPAAPPAVTVPAASAPANSGTAAPAPAGTPLKPDVMIGEVALKGLAVDVTDLAGPRPAQLALTDLQASLRNVTLADNASMPLHVAFGWAPQGTVQVDGAVSIAPVKADVKVAVTGLELRPLSPYLEQFAAAKLTEGAVTVNLEAHAAMPAGKPLDASVAGDVRVDRFGLVDGAHNEELAGVSALAIRGLRAATAPELSVAMDEIAINGPFARVIMNSDRTLNVAAVLQNGKPVPAAKAAARAEGTTLSATPPAAQPAAASAPMPKIEIGKVVIADGDYRFTDRSVEPNVRMAISKFGGEISGLSSTNPGKGTINLTAMVDGAGPIAIAGKLDPLGPKTAVDLKVDFKNVDLVPLSPYSGKFAGYELARGKLLLDVKLLVDGKKIDASNVITLNQFTFGAPVQSPDATKLPVRLGIALLKDLDGKIVIDVPVSGDLADPSFSVGRVVLRVVVNLLTKAAVSPFSLIGAAFGGGDELAYQEFGAGSAELQPAEVKKLETMVKALTNRPGLSVALEGHYDPAADTYALRRVRLADQVRRAVWEKKHAADPNIAPPAQLVISPEENAAMIKQLFDEKFPPGTKFGTPVPPPPAVVASPPAPQGFFQRVVAAITFKAQREKRVADRENARLSAEHEKAVAAAIATGMPLDEMVGRLAETVTIDDNDLRALAQARAQQVRDYFATTGKIAPDRVFLSQTKTEEAAAAAKGPRVFLSLQ